MSDLPNLLTKGALDAFAKESPTVQARILAEVDARFSAREASFIKTFLTGRPHEVKP